MPSPNNPYFTKEDYLDELRKHGGEDNDDFQQLILGKHGTAALSVISRDQIPQAAYDFYNVRYTAAEVNRGISFRDHFDRPKFEGYNTLIAAIDTGFADPTIIHIVGQSEKGVWRILARYRLQRIQFPMQEEIIDWLDDFYKFDVIAIDVGSGGGGVQIVQSLAQRVEYQHKNYNRRLKPVQFAEKVTVGFNIDGSEMSNNSKTVGAQQLVMMFLDSTLEMCEIDNEGISEMERITRQKLTTGADQYFIMNERGNGKALEDHIFASLICFAIAVRDTSNLVKKRKKLGRTRGKVL